MVLDSEIIDYFEDLAISAFRGRNAKVGAFKTLIEMAQRGIFQNAGIDHVIVEAFDRLSRLNVDDAYQQFRRLILTGMTVHIRMLGTVYNQNSLNDPQALMGAIMFMSLANQESAQKSKRLASVRQKNRDDARAGIRRMTTVGPYWLKWDDSQQWNGHKGWFKPTTERVRTVRMIFEMSAQGHTVFHIHRELTRLGIPTFRTDKQKAKVGWSTTVISKILSNRAVLGEMHPHKFVEGKSVLDGPVITGYYPPVISVDLFNRAQAGRRPKNWARGRTSKNTNLFRRSRRVRVLLERRAQRLGATAAQHPTRQII